jgi:type II secretory pathway pseudopilin PulG
MKTSLIDSPRSIAFTRIELLAVLGALGVLASVAGPGLANNKPHSQRAVCVNNLRLIGRAFQEWASEHGDIYPFRMEAISQGGGYSMDGGTIGHPLDNNAWFQYSWVSNQLGTPKILICPSDSPSAIRAQRRTASNFGASNNGGFMHLEYQNNATSYILSLTSLYDYPQTIVSGDYNLGGLSPGASGPGGIASAYGAYPPNVRWTNSVHGECGNLVLSGGQVLQLSTEGLRRALSDASAVGPYPSYNQYFLIPQ